MPIDKDTKYLKYLSGGLEDLVDALKFGPPEYDNVVIRSAAHDLRWELLDHENIAEEIEKLRAKSRALTTSIFGSLTPWQITQLARHPQRPYTLDYIGGLMVALDGSAKGDVRTVGTQVDNTTITNSVSSLWKPEERKSVPMIGIEPRIGN